MLSFHTCSVSWGRRLCLVPSNVAPLLPSSWGASPPDPPEQVQGPGSLRMPPYGLSPKLSMGSRYARAFAWSPSCPLFDLYDVTLAVTQRLGTRSPRCSSEDLGAFVCFVSPIYRLRSQWAVATLGPSYGLLPVPSSIHMTYPNSDATNYAVFLGGHPRPPGAGPRTWVPSYDPFLPPLRSI